MSTNYDTHETFKEGFIPSKEHLTGIFRAAERKKEEMSGVYEARNLEYDAGKVETAYETAEESAGQALQEFDSLGDLPEDAQKALSVALSYASPIKQDREQDHDYTEGMREVNRHVHELSSKLEGMDPVVGFENDF